MKGVGVVVAAFFFVGCSMQSPHNKWEYELHNSFQSYTKNFLSQRDVVAKNDYKRSITKAKSSASLNPLARVYLGKCALDIAVEKQNSCQEYLEIADVVDDEALQNYYYMLQREFRKIDPATLPKNYQAFISALQRNDYKTANSIVQEETTPQTKLLMARLLEENLSDATLQSTLELLSEYGYKRGVLYLLEKKLQRSDDPQEQKRLQKIIEVLKN